MRETGERSFHNLKQKNQQPCDMKSRAHPKYICHNIKGESRITKLNVEVKATQFHPPRPLYPRITELVSPGTTIPHTKRNTFKAKVDTDNILQDSYACNVLH